MLIYKSVFLGFYFKKLSDKMSDHDNYCNYGNEINIGAEDVVEGLNSENIVEERNGDEFLIELYRERPFLYDKKNQNFKNILIKENGWKEISKIMISINYGNYHIQLFIELLLFIHVFICSLIVITGDIYTPQYCQKRCCSLREQYNREKEKDR